MEYQEARRAVRGVIEQELTDLHGMWEGAAAEEHNVFLMAISPQLAIGSKLSRQLTSRMGRKLARIARNLAELRFGHELVPRHLHNPELEDRPQVAANSDDTFVYSDYDHARAEALALELVTRAKAAKIGTDEFREAYHAALEELRQGPRSDKVWYFQVDLAVLSPEIGFAELESGGQLDSSNAIGQTRKLIQAGLAYGDPQMPLHFCTAYANKGEGRQIIGSLRSYFLQDPDHRDGLLAGSRWWERILPPEVSFDDFLEEFHIVAEEYEIAGPQE